MSYGTDNPVRVQQHRSAMQAKARLEGGDGRLRQLEEALELRTHEASMLREEVANVKAALGKMRGERDALVKKCMSLRSAVLDDESREKPTPTRRAIIAAVAEAANVTVDDMVSARRNRAATAARQIAMFLCKRMTPSSLPEIGKSLGGRDHTTVLHGVRKVAAAIDGGCEETLPVIEQARAAIDAQMAEVASQMLLREVARRNEAA